MVQRWVWYVSVFAASILSADDEKGALMIVSDADRDFIPRIADRTQDTLDMEMGYKKVVEIRG